LNVLGARGAIKIVLVLICSDQPPLAQAVIEAISGDLFYQLNVFPIGGTAAARAPRVHSSAVRDVRQEFSNSMGKAIARSRTIRVALRAIPVPATSVNFVM